MLRAARRMIPDRDAPGDLNMLAPWPSPIRAKDPMWFGAVRTGKAYVSYHLMPLYTHPELLESLSPDLKTRMQGKSCFNFRSADRTLFAELEKLTRAAAKAYAVPFSPRKE